MKTVLTTKIENAVYEFLYLERSYRLAFEVELGTGRVDIFGYHSKEGHSICVEVKVTEADFKSKNGHNFYANKNYYAVPEFLVEKIIDKVPPHVGIIAYSEAKPAPYIAKRYEYNLGRLPVIRTAKNAKKVEESLPPRYRAQMRRNFETALCSNIRRLHRDYLANRLKETKNDNT